MSGSLLPELHEAAADGPQVAALLAALEREAEIRSVRVRGQAEGVDCVALAAGLAAGVVRAAQVRYRLGGAEWVDTILATADGFRVVRMAVAPPP